MPNFSFRQTSERGVPRSAGTPRGPLTALLAVALVLVLTACAGTRPSPRELAGDRLLVLTTFTVIADMVREVGGEHVWVESVTKVGAEIHGYEPTPDDLRRAADADLILDNGLGLEAWFASFTAQLDVPRATLSEGVDPLPVAEFSADAAPRGEHAAAGSEAPANPHAWMSPLVGAQYARTIARALSEADPEHAEAYAANAERYAGELTALHTTLVDALAQIPEPARILATCEGAFSYLARDAGLREVYLWPVNAEQQSTPARMEAAIDAVRDAQVPTIFCESTVSANSQKQVAAEAGSTYGGALYVDSLSGPDGPVPTYVDLLTYDVDLIIAGLGGTLPTSAPVPPADGATP